jgi:exopolyphosphatase/guanosine-5'-triphosphate,3'-diphosphate pyrophosphatase
MSARGEVRDRSRRAVARGSGRWSTSRAREGGPHLSELIALLDLGSNAARFMLVKIRPGRGFVVLDKARVQTRLAGGVSASLPAPAVRKTLRAIHAFLAPARRRGVARVVALATAAIREADNADLLLSPLRRHRADIRILSGLEEARLAARVVAATMGLASGVVVDLGGGSMQLAVLRRGGVQSAVSVPLGAVRATAQYLRGDPPTAVELAALRAAVRDLAGGALPPGRRGAVLIGLGGTVRALARILRAEAGGGKEIHGASLSRGAVADIAARLAAMPLRRRRGVDGLKSERADIIVAGAVIVEELMAMGGYERLVVCTQGVRHAVLIEETFGRVPSA